MLPHQSTSPALTFLIEFADRALAAGVDMVQIRERELPARAVFIVTEALAESARRKGARLLVNDRSDIAASAGSGVHLTTRSLSVEVVRRAFGPEMLVGVSTHTFEEARAAQQGGADFVVFGPVFETASKEYHGEPVGLETLHQVATRLTIPVVALGGIKPTNFREALDAGAAGVAGISMFAEAQDLSSLVATIKGRGVA
ncbi:MAG TPA: thiamine phosphate synthase [Blastocatellia bacterium]|nr:thiamine phosphate synthase [Blastocatellia bacterium]